MVVGGGVLPALETWRRGGAHRFFSDRHNYGFHAALSALSFSRSERTLGSGSNSPRCFGVRSLLGRTATNVHLHVCQPFVISDQPRRGSASTPVLDTAAVSSMAESPRRVRAGSCTADCLWCRPDRG